MTRKKNYKINTRSRPFGLKSGLQAKGNWREGATTFTIMALRIKTLGIMHLILDAEPV